MTWSNGYKHTFYRARLTRYNSYVVWSNYAGIHMQQSFERAFARYASMPPQHIYTGSRGYEVHLGVTEKVNVAGNYPRSNPLLARSNQNQAPASQDQTASNQNRAPSNKYKAAPEDDSSDRQYASNDSGGGDSQTTQTASLSRSRTRDLVFEDEDEEDTPPVVSDSTAAAVSGDAIAVKATVELTRDGNVTTVLPTEPFKSGDKVRLLFTTNRDGYVYWLAKGTSGQYQVLFPNSKTGTDNSIKRNAEYTVPVRGAWRFDENPGTETIVCILAPDRVPDIDEAIKLADGGDTARSSEIVAKLIGGHETRRTTTRDLVFEEEDEGDVNTKIQVTNGGDPFVATYELEHL